MLIGDIRVDGVLDGAMAVPPLAQFRNSSGDVWDDRHRAALDGQGNVVNQLGGYLVRTADRVAVIDFGIGEAPKPPIAGGSYLASLAALGVAPEDVTDALFTHLHVDHIGWATQDGRPTFPNARYRCHELDWAYFVTGDRPTQAWEETMVRPEDYAHNRLAPLADRLDPWSADGPVLPGVDVLQAPGHSPGHTAFVFSSGGERGAMIGDVVHSQVELLEPELRGERGPGDEDPPRALETLHAVLEMLLADGIPCAASHLPGLAWGRLVERDGTRRWLSA